MGCNPFKDDCGLDVGTIDGCHEGVQLAAEILDIGMTALRPYFCPTSDCTDALVGFVSHGPPPFPPSVYGSYMATWLMASGIPQLPGVQGAPSSKIALGSRRRRRVTAGLWLGPVTVPEMTQSTLYLLESGVMDRQGRLSTIIAETWWTAIFDEMRGDGVSIEGLQATSQNKEEFYWTTTVIKDGVI